ALRVVGLAAVAFLVELAQQLLLALRQIHRRLDHRLDVHVAALGRAQDRHALGPEAELVAGLRSGRDGDLGPAAVDRRHLDAAAEGRRRHRDGDAAMDVGAVALEQAMRRDREEDVEIARRRPAHAALALAGEADAGAVLDAGRDRDGEGLLLAHAALAGAGAARLLDDAAGALARGAGALDGEEALLRAHAARALAGRAVDRLRPRLGAAPLAGLALRQGRHAHARLLALEGVFQADLEVVSEVAAAPRPLAALAADEIAEHLVEDVGKAAGAEAEAGAAAGTVAAVLEGGVTEAVIGRALLLVREDLVGLAQLLELVLGRRVPRVAVGVVLHRQLAIGLLDVLGAGPAPHAQELVKILLSHRSPKPCRQACGISASRK